MDPHTTKFARHRQRAGWLSLALCSFACAPSEEDPVLADAASPPAGEQGKLALVDALDVLLVIDDSGSMASEQLRLASELTRLIDVLTRGDRTPEAPPEPDRSNKARYFNPVKSLHLGVISANVGGIDDPYGESAGINACQGSGDDGRLQHSTEVARDGVVASSAREFEGFAESEVVIAPDPGCALEAGPPYLVLEPGDDHERAQAVAQRFRCVARLGVRGCPFEQPFEAVYRALAPPLPVGARLQARPVEPDAARARAYNAGFLRENAVLALVFVGDEDDCSITPQGKELYDNTPNSEAERRYTREINLRCGKFANEKGLLWDVERYADHLRALKPGHPERLVINAIVGVPPELVNLGADVLLMRPELQYTVDATGHLWRPSCTRLEAANPSRRDTAQPPRRFLELAGKLGPSVHVASICADAYGGTLAALVDRVAPMMAP
jgi:hypothetical protein